MIEPGITETEAAKYLTDRGFHIKPQTLRAWRFRGKGPPYLRPGGRIRYRMSDLDLFVEDSRIVPGEKRLRRRMGARPEETHHYARRGDSRKP